MFTFHLLVLVTAVGGSAIKWERRDGTSVFYSYVYIGLTMSEASDYCIANNGSLLYITSEDENLYINAKYYGNHDYCWIAFTDEGHEGNWVWIDGTPVVYERWFISQPGGGMSENCAVLHRWYSWHDIDCSRTFPFICKAVDNLDECSTNTLNDCQQNCINTLKGYNCSCFDGYLYNSTSETCLASAITWERRGETSVYYSYAKYALTMSQAKDFCIANKGSLLYITSEDENLYINSKYYGNHDYCWIAFTDEGHEGNWVWIDGTPVVYERWYPRQPNGGISENCAVLHRWNAWHDVNCFNTFLFICKAVDDLDECSTNALNDCQQTCINTLGGYNCSCFDGYLYNSTSDTCLEIDECSEPTLNNCQQNCTNTPGSYNCSCFNGYFYNSTLQKCQDIDECSSLTNVCKLKCINYDGGYECTVPIEVKTFDVNGSKSIEANYGDSVVLHCEVTGSGGTFAVLSGPELSTFKNHTLNTAVIDKPLANLNCKDSGRYYCWGQNGGGERSIQDYVDINITCLVEPPPVYQGKPYQPEKQITVESEKNTTFKFVVYGYPEPTSYDLRIETKSNSYTDVNSTHYDVHYVHLEPPFGLVTLTIFDENTKETITYVLGINSEKGRVEVTVEVIKVLPKPPKDDTTTQMAIGIGVGVGGFLIVVVIVVVCTVKCRRSRTPAVTRGVPMEQLYDKAGPVYNDRHYALAYENKIANDYDLPQN